MFSKPRDFKLPQPLYRKLRSPGEPKQRKRPFSPPAPMHAHAAHSRTPNAPPKQHTQNAGQRTCDHTCPHAYIRSYIQPAAQSITNVSRNHTCTADHLATELIHTYRPTYVHTMHAPYSACFVSRHRRRHKLLFASWACDGDCLIGAKPRGQHAYVRRQSCSIPDVRCAALRSLAARLPTERGQRNTCSQQTAMRSMQCPESRGCEGRGF
ncbi:hypothetical protein IQ07DRAFT_392145 [Pyrenochaeta sp. DS3sAY3a]|nr:hypothetical protein IQ07DRAFT_392145 [Pyrenochaeta sp. DS3sAY3a]